MDGPGNRAPYGMSVGRRPQQAHGRLIFKIRVIIVFELRSADHIPAILNQRNLILKEITEVVVEAAGRINVYEKSGGRL